MTKKPMEPILEINYLSASYGQHQVLEDINLNIERGEILAVIGPNGAGKTTLIRSISGLIHPSKGKIQVCGKDLSELTIKQRARYMAVVPQARNLPSAYTVQQTVMMGRTPYLGWMGVAGLEDIDTVKQVLIQTHTANFSDKRVGELSGGEQQRVLVARALAQHTPILLLDEPTAHLDLQHQSTIMNLVIKAAHEQGLAVLLAAHDINLVALYAKRVAILVNGGLIALGSPNEVLTSKNIETAFHVPVRVIQHPDYGTPLILPDGHQSFEANSVATNVMKEEKADE